MESIVINTELGGRVGEDAKLKELRSSHSGQHKRPKSSRCKSVLKRCRGQCGPWWRLKGHLWSTAAFSPNTEILTIEGVVGMRESRV